MVGSCKICSGDCCLVPCVTSHRAKTENTTPEAATQEDWEIPQPDDGTPQCVFFGDCWTEDWFVLGYGNYRYSAIRK